MPRCCGQRVSAISKVTISGSQRSERALDRAMGLGNRETRAWDCDLRLITTLSYSLQLFRERVDLRFEPFQAGIVIARPRGARVRGGRLLLQAVRRKHPQGTFEERHILLAHLFKLTERKDAERRLQILTYLLL